MSASFERYVMGSDQQPTETPPVTYGPTIRVVNGVERTAIIGGVLSTDDQPRVVYSSANNNPHHGTDSVFATARTKTGRPVEVVQGDTLLTINGLQAPADFWAGEGWLTKNADGSFAEVVGGPQAAPEAAPDGDFSPLSDQDMAAVNQALDPIPQEYMDGIASRAVGVAAGALDADRLVAHITTTTGMDPEEARQRFTAASAVYQRQADTALSAKYGVPPGDVPAFWAWAKANHRAELQDAAFKQYQRHETTGYAGLAARYLAQHAPSLGAFQKAGVPVRGRGAVTSRRNPAMRSRHIPASRRGAEVHLEALF